MRRARPNHARWLLPVVLAACRDDPAPASAAPVAPSCGDEAAAIADPRDAAVARALCGELRSHGVPGAVVAIAEAGAPSFAFAHGVRCVGAPERVSTATAFRIGSLTKAITAAAAFALAERRVLDLAAPIGAAALADVGLPDALAGATIRHLLDHRAGLTDVLPNEGLRGRPPGEQLAALVGTPVAPAPAPWRYANGGYALAGALMAASAGRPWAELVEHEVFVPLGMSSARARAEPVGDTACGHLREGQGWRAYDVRADYERFAFGVDAAAPSGAAIAAADDLLRLALGLSDTAVDPPAWATRMRTAVVESTVETGRRARERYAAGIDVTSVGDVIVLRHAGDTGDFHAELVWVPSRGVAAVVLANAGTPMAATMAAALARLGVDPRRD